MNDEYTCCCCEYMADMEAGGGGVYWDGEADDAGVPV